MLMSDKNSEDDQRKIETTRKDIDQQHVDQKPTKNYTFIIHSFYFHLFPTEYVCSMYSKSCKLRCAIKHNLANIQIFLYFIGKLQNKKNCINDLTSLIFPKISTVSYIIKGCRNILYHPFLGWEVIQPLSVSSLAIK